MTLQELARQRILAKAIEDNAVAERRKIDKQIADLLLDPSKPEGTVSQAPEGFKVTVTYGVTRKLDTKKLQSDWTNLPPAVQDSIKWKAELATTKFRDLDKDAVLVLSTYMETKPSAPTVEVKAAE